MGPWLRLAIVGVLFGVCLGGNPNGKYERKSLDRDHLDDGKTRSTLMDTKADICEDVNADDRFDCGPQNDQHVCEERGCCWRTTNEVGAPFCFYPPNYNTFKVVNMTEMKNGLRINYERGRLSGYPNDFAQAVADFVFHSDDILQIKIYDPTQKRFEPPLPEIPVLSSLVTKPKYTVQASDSEFGFKVIRKADNAILMDTNVGAMILSDKFLQLSTLLPTDRIFGMGENRDRFKKDLYWRTITLFNRDQPPYPDTSLYGSHPFYLALEKRGNSHGLFLLNSNAIDVVFQPTPAITFRAIGGIFNFFLFVGPTPDEVLSQYTSIIGRPFMPPYWSLGFHLCKFGYGSLDNTKKIWKQNRDANIPFDTQWNDIDYMENRNDFTYDTDNYKELPQFPNELHSVGMHYMMLIDPGVSGSEKRGTYPPYDRGLQMNVFVKNNSDLPFVGKVWNRQSTVYPDFTHPNGTGYWSEMLTDFHKKVNYDGVWIDMNEPSNLITGQIYGGCDSLNLPYKPVWLQNDINRKTICMEAKHYIGRHYDVHSLYGLYEAAATNFALKEIRGKRPFIISRASFPGLGRYAGHWSGDISSSWDDMRYTIPDLLSFSLFGIPMMGADICGFGGDATPQLCKRWMQLGAFYPFSRNHADINSKPQDPVSMGAEVVAASLAALRLRYRLLPHYYTLFWRAHTDGTTVVTPLNFLQPNLRKLDTIDDQFLIGRHVMIAPILHPDVETTRAFFPWPDWWYNIIDGQPIACGNHANITDQQMVSVRGGVILPLQEPPLEGPVTTTNTRSQPLQLYVVPRWNGSAKGELYWDDGESINSYTDKKYSHIEFTLNDQDLNGKVIWWGYDVPAVNNITILAQKRDVNSVTINGIETKFEQNKELKILYIKDILLSLDKPFTVKWTYAKSNSNYYYYKLIYHYNLRKNNY